MGAEEERLTTKSVMVGGDLDKQVGRLPVREGYDFEN